MRAALVQMSVSLPPIGRVQLITAESVFFLNFGRELLSCCSLLPSIVKLKLKRAVTVWQPAKRGLPAIISYHLPSPQCGALLYNILLLLNVWVWSNMYLLVISGGVLDQLFLSNEFYLKQKTKQTSILRNCSITLPGYHRPSNLILFRSKGESGLLMTSASVASFTPPTHTLRLSTPPGGEVYMLE